MFRVVVLVAFAGLLTYLAGCGGTTSTDAAGAAGAAAFQCIDLGSAASAGFARCQGGLVHRVSAGACDPPAPSAATIADSPAPELDACHSDGECTAHPYGYCIPGRQDFGVPPVGNTCLYRCAVDTDCTAGELCDCTATLPLCVPAGCHVDGDCAAGLYCARSTHATPAPDRPDCPTHYTYSCQRETDACFTDGDCGTGMSCSESTSGRVCASSCAPPS